MSKPEEFENGDKVFLLTEQRLATVLDNYGNPSLGDRGDMRLDVSGNTSMAHFMAYDPEKHAAFDHTFVPIKAETKAFYGITKDIPLRAEEESSPAP